MNELIFNLWAYYNSKTGFIVELSGRAYCAKGNDESKLNLLDSLARTDYVTTHRFQVPSRFQIKYPDGTYKKNVITYPILSILKAEVFEEVFLAIESKLPIRSIIKNDCLIKEKQITPDSPLSVITVLYVDDKGKIIPLITDEDRKCAAEQQEISNWTPLGIN